MKIKKLLNGLILVRLDDEQKQTKSGILLTENTTERPRTGVVQAIADDVTQVKVGDRVEFLRYAALTGLDKDSRLCKEIHIMAVLEDDQEN